MLRNCGSASGPVTATLESDSPWLVVREPSGHFPAAEEGETTASAGRGFVLSVLPGAPTEVHQRCLLVLAGSGYCETLQVPLVVGDSMNLPAGPDAYGFRIYDRTDSAYILPRYDWCDRQGAGTRLVLGDDETVTLRLPVRFGAWRYYGQDYESLSVCSNGWVAPGTTSRRDFVNVILPYANAPPNTVALCWDNLDPSAHGAVWFYDDSLGDRLVIEFDSVPYFAPADKWEKAQLQVHGRSFPTPSGDNALSMHFKTFNYYKTGTVGLQNRDGTAGLTHLWDVWYPRVAAPLGAGQALLLMADGPSGACEPKPAPQTGRVSAGARPNPFSALTTLTLGPDLDRSAKARVLDVAGRAVVSLQVLVSKGAAQAAWDGRDRAGRPAPAGVYFAEVSGGGNKALVRLELVR